MMAGINPGPRSSDHSRAKWGLAETWLPRVKLLYVGPSGQMPYGA